MQISRSPFTLLAFLAIAASFSLEALAAPARDVARVGASDGSLSLFGIEAPRGI